jgi:hypothetical protein
MSAVVANMCGVLMLTGVCVVTGVHCMQGVRPLYDCVAWQAVGEVHARHGECAWHAAVLMCAWAWLLRHICQVV